jgi:hypothetical protein
MLCAISRRDRVVNVTPSRLAFDLRSDYFKEVNRSQDRALASSSRIGILALWIRGANAALASLTLGDVALWEGL